MFTKTKLLAKYAKKFTAQNELAPVFQGIHYAADGSANVTNRHYALRIEGAHSFKTAITIDAKTGTPLIGEFPSVEKVIPKEPGTEVVISAKELEKAMPGVRATAEVAKRIKLRSLAVDLSVAAGDAQCLEIDLQDFVIGTTMSILIEKFIPESIAPRHVNADYLHTALSLFHDAGKGVRIQFGMMKVDPVVLKNEDGITVLILPIRISN